MRTLAVLNQKGGVGKTTTVANVAAGLAAGGQRVLAIDLDPQAHLTIHLGTDPRQIMRGSYRVLTASAPIAEAAVQVRENLWLVGASVDLVGAESELVSVVGREIILREALESVADRFDYLLIDCPPSLGLLTLNALVAADAVLIPLHCEYFALEGLADLVGTMRRVRASLNPTLDIEGVLLTMYDERTNLGQQVAADVRQFFKEKVFRTVIPRNVRLGEAPSHGLPVLLYDAKSRGADAYVALAREVLERAAPPAA